MVPASNALFYCLFQLITQNYQTVVTQFIIVSVLLFSKYCKDKIFLFLRCNNPIKDCNRLLDLTGPLQIAGLPVLPSSGHVSNQDFVGCISDVQLDHQPLDLGASIADYMTGIGCPPKELRCQSSPCKLGGMVNIYTYLSTSQLVGWSLEYLLCMWNKLIGTLI